jgi:hypothetical protein
VSALGCLIIQCRPNSKANGLAMLKHLFPLFEYRSEATSGQSVLGWVCVHPISKETAEQLLASGVVSHREELIQSPKEGRYPLVGPGPMTCDPATIKTNKQTKIPGSKEGRSPKKVPQSSPMPMLLKKLKKISPKNPGPKGCNLFSNSRPFWMFSQSVVRLEPSTI